MTESLTTTFLCDFIRSRAAIGLEKYEVTLDRTDLTALDWLKHSLEEKAHDLGYTHRAIQTVTALIEENQELKAHILAQADLSSLKTENFQPTTPTSDPSAYYRAGLRDLLSAGVLALLQRVGPSGLTTPEIGIALGNPAAAIGPCCHRLVKAGLITQPARDSKQGRPNRYTITPAGTAVTQDAHLPQVQSSHQLTLLNPQPTNDDDK